MWVVRMGSEIISTFLKQARQTGGCTAHCPNKTLQTLKHQWLA